MSDNHGRIFTCPECSLVFKKRSHLLRHKLIHTDDRPFQCDQCEKSFRTQFHLNRHAATHSGEKNFRCDYDGCQVACITQWNLKRHIRRTHMGKFKCDKCGEEFKKNKLLQQHNSTEHKKSIISCPFPACGQIFPLPSKMRHHMKMHTEKGYICPVKDCSQKFNLWSECRVHAAACKKKEVSCDVCGKIFRERSNLKAHSKIHLEQREVFQCTYDGCGRFYTKQYNLKVHVQSFHLNLRPYVCSKDGCNKRFHFQHLLRKHHESMHDKRLDDSCEKKERKKKCSTRINATNVSSSITGYIPELWTRMTPDEIKSYVDGEKQLSDNEESSSDSIQVDKTPLLEDAVQDVACEILQSEEEENTDDTVPVHHSSDEFETVTELIEIKPLLYKPILVRRPIKKVPMANTYTSNSIEISPFAKWEQDECMVTGPPELLGASSSTKQRECISAHLQLPLSHDAKNKLVPDGMEDFRDKFRNMFDASKTPNSLNIQRLCRIQSINESDSSDSDAQNRVPCVS